MSREAADNSTLVIFCRRPAPGVGKQRIAAATGAELALALGEHLLATTVEDAKAWPGPVVLAPALDTDRDWAATLLRRDASVVPQGDGNLGARLNRVDHALRALGHERLLFIGSDAPLLDEPYFTGARRALDHADVVLGPAADGGVTLMGSRVAWPELADLPWSTGELGRALHERCAAHGLMVHRLDERYDVDDAGQLLRLCIDLQGDPRPARRALHGWLRETLDTTSPLTVTVIIPVLGDTEPLRRLVQRLRSMSPAPDEIIVVDGGHSDDCEAICRDQQIRYRRSGAGRGRQLREGAAQARGDVLWFLHADAEPPIDALRLIRQAIAEGISGGYFQFRFAGEPRWHKTLLAGLINIRSGIGVPYGDQGIFATRPAYDAAGGFADAPLFEEVPLVRRLRQHGQFVALPGTIGVSPRRWERDGWLRRTVENRLLALGYMAGVSPQRLAQRYRKS